MNPKEKNIGLMEKNKFDFFLSYIKMSTLTNVNGVAIEGVIEDAIGGSTEGAVKSTNSTTGTQTHYVNGKLHCDNGPAIINYSGEYWYKNGLLHRDIEPAVNMPKRKEWYSNGKLHNLNGPAVIYMSADGKERKEYWINGVREYDY